MYSLFEEEISRMNPQAIAPPLPLQPTPTAGEYNSSMIKLLCSYYSENWHLYWLLLILPKLITENSCHFFAKVVMCKLNGSWMCTHLEYLTLNFIPTNWSKCEHYYFYADLAKHSIIGTNDVYVYTWICGYKFPLLISLSGWSKLTKFYCNYTCKSPRIAPCNL